MGRYYGQTIDSNRIIRYKERDSCIEKEDRDRLRER